MTRPGSREVLFVDATNRAIGTGWAIVLAAILLTPGVGLLWSGEQPVRTGLVAVALALALSAWRNRVVLDGRRVKVGYFVLTRVIDLTEVAEWRLRHVAPGGKPREWLVATLTSGEAIVLARYGVRARPGTPQSERLHALRDRLEAASVAARSGGPAAP